MACIITNHSHFLVNPFDQIRQRKPIRHTLNPVFKRNTLSRYRAIWYCLETIERMRISNFKMRPQKGIQTKKPSETLSKGFIFLEPTIRLERTTC